MIEFGRGTVQAANSCLQDVPSEKQAVKSKSSGQRSRRKLIVRRLAAGVGLGYALLLAFSFGHQFFQLNGINRDINRVQQEIVSMREKNRDLSQELRRLQSDAYVERIARENLGLVKPGETVLLQAEVTQGGPERRGTSVDTRE